MGAATMLHLDVLPTALEGSYQLTIIAALCAGVLSHFCILKTKVDPESMMWHILGSYIVLLSALTWAQLSLTDWSVFQAVGNTLLAAASFNTGLTASILIYRLFLHPLRHFPGPPLAKASMLYVVWVIHKSGVRYHEVLDGWHKRYGDVVRVGPRHLSILRRSAVEDVLAKCQKATWYDQVSPDDRKSSLHMTRDLQLHRRRREIYDLALSGKAINEYKVSIETKVDQLMARIAASNQEPIDFTELSKEFAFDVMGLVGYSIDFGNLSRGRQHEAVKDVGEHMTALGRFGPTPWILYIFGCIPHLAAKGYMNFFKWCADRVDEKLATWTSDQRPRDIMSYIVTAYQEKSRSAPPSRFALDQDSRVVAVAGSDTTANTSANAFCLLANNPEKFRKLQQQIDEAEANNGKIDNIPYLTSVIKETLRLKPSVLTGGSRLTPPNGVSVDEIKIPGGVIASVPIQLIQRDPRYYKFPEEFIPERWSEEKESEEPSNGRMPFIAFGRARYRCPGEKLAYVTLQAEIARIVQQYDVSFAPGESEALYDSKVKDIFTSLLPPLRLIFTPRRRKQAEK